MTYSTDTDQPQNEKPNNASGVSVNGVPLEELQGSADAFTWMDPALLVSLLWNPIADIKMMHEHYGLTYDGPPRVLDVEEARFRGDFKLEEVEEWRKHAGRALMVLNTDPTDHAAITEELAEQLDALVDAMVIVLGTAYRQGMLHLIPEAWRRVLVANMAKQVGKTSRGFAADLVKPPGWEAPDHTDLVEEHAHR